MNNPVTEKQKRAEEQRLEDIVWHKGQRFRKTAGEFFYGTRKKSRGRRQLKKDKKTLEKIIKYSKEYENAKKELETFSALER